MKHTLVAGAMLVGSIGVMSRLGAEFLPTLEEGSIWLRATMPANLVDAMQAKGPAPREYDPESRPVMELLRGLLEREFPTEGTP